MRTMMGIASPTGSHLPVLEAEVRALPAGALVVEHGAGLYSTPLLAKLGVRVVCSEPHEGWGEWARWIYEGRVEMTTAALDYIGEAALVFIDGPAKERGPLLQGCLDRGVPVIVAHDTQRREWRYYDFKPHMFERDDYEVTHHAEDSHRTTMWKKKP